MTTPKKYSRISPVGHAAKFSNYSDATTLETVRNEKAKLDYWIPFDCREFTCMCPITGQPDFAQIRIEYAPDKLCIETKSLESYLASFRSTRAFNEEIVNRILDDIVAACQPRHALVHGEFAHRADEIGELLPELVEAAGANRHAQLREGIFAVGGRDRGDLLLKDHPVGAMLAKKADVEPQGASPVETVRDPEKGREAWLDPGTSTEKLQTFLVPFDASKMEAYPISKRFGSPKSDDAEIISRIPRSLHDEECRLARCPL